MNHVRSYLSATVVKTARMPIKWIHVAVIVFQHKAFLFFNILGNSFALFYGKGTAFKLANHNTMPWHFAYSPIGALTGILTGVVLPSFFPSSFKVIFFFLKEVQ